MDAFQSREKPKAIIPTMGAGRKEGYLVLASDVPAQGSAFPHGDIAVSQGSLSGARNTDSGKGPSSTPTFTGAAEEQGSEGGSKSKLRVKGLFISHCLPL